MIGTQQASRRRWLGALIGLAVGALLVGLALPASVPERATERASNRVDAGPSRLAPAGDAGRTAPAGADERATAAAPADSGVRRRGSSGSGETGSVPPPTSGTAPGGAASAQAGDPGVSPDTIDLGLMIFDIGGASRVGVNVPGADPAQQREWWDAWVADLNGRGGVHGRQVRPSYYQYDVLNADSMRAACLKATEDDGVFAALDTGSIGQGTAQCFTREHGTPLLSLGSTGFTEQDFQRSDGLLFSMFADGRRMMANFVWELDQLGALRRQAAGQRVNKTIGILSSDVPGSRETIDAGVVATLRQLGYEVAEWSHVSSDAGTAASQVPVAVNQMRTKGVDAVILMAGIIQTTQFVQHADGQRYRPAYFANDWLGAWSETFVRNMPDSFDGTLITTSRTGERHSGHPETREATECLDIFERESGRRIERDKDSVEHWSSLLTCSLFRMFELGAKAAGPELTRRALSDGLQSLGEIPMMVFGGGSLAPGKFGAADLVRTAKFDTGCDCWLPADEFRRPRF